MPEGVEVRLLAEEIADLITGSRLTAVSVLSGRYAAKPPEGLKALSKKLPAQVKVVGVAGKFMWWETAVQYAQNMQYAQNTQYAMFTLGMSGGWTLIRTEYNRVEFTFAKGGHTIRLYLLDVRNFATIKFAGENVLKHKLEALGPDMFSRSWTEGSFSRALDDFEGQCVANALMGQKLVAGPGAYIVAEALYISGVAPRRKVRSLTADERSRIYRAIRAVAGASYAANKDAISIYKLAGDIKDANKFQFKIYGKDKDTKGNKVETYQIGDRNIKWVPAIQK